MARSKSVKTMELYWQDIKLAVKRYWITGRQYVAVRRTKRLVLFASGILVVALTYWMLRKPYNITSAVTCKSKIAQMAIRQAEKRSEYLNPMGNNFRELENDFFYYVTTLRHNCQDQVHIGPADDGGWEVCLERRFNIASPCLVYSFGIGHDFRFEKGIEELLQCEVHAFDPSMEVEEHQYSTQGFFHNIGIDHQESYANRGRWKMRRLVTIMKELGHTGRTIDYLKMDIEFSEWPALYDMISTGLIHKVRQMALEIHTPEMDIHIRPDHVCTWSTSETLTFMMRVLIDLKNAGFSLYYSRTNYRTQFKSVITGLDRYCCHDLHFVNLKHEANAYIS